MKKATPGSQKRIEEKLLGRMKMIGSNWAKKKFITPIVHNLKQGISTEHLSVSLALGAIVGLIPLYGVATAMVGVLSVSLRLNFIAMQVAHYIVHPLQLALLVPFLKVGDALVKSTDVSFTIRQYIHLFKADFWGALRELWMINLSAIGVWLVLSIPLYFVLYHLIRKYIRKYALNLRRLPV